MRSWNKDNVNILLSHVPWEKDPHSLPRPSSLLSPIEIASWSFMSVFLSDECPQKRIYPLKNLWEIRFRRSHCCKQPWGRLRKWARLCSRVLPLKPHSHSPRHRLIWKPMTMPTKTLFSARINSNDHHLPDWEQPRFSQRVMHSPGHYHS